MHNRNTTNNNNKNDKEDEKNENDEAEKWSRTINARLCNCIRSASCVGNFISARTSSRSLTASFVCYFFP